jgi:hypothetical protein
MRLGERLLAERLISDAQLQEALEAQVVHGGRLGTNLVELGHLKEGDLARVLGQVFGVGFSSGEMKPDPQALAHVDARFMDTHDLLPMRADATRLTVAVVDPRDFRLLDQLAFSCGKRVVPVVIPEFRMNQLLRRHANAWRPVRALDMHLVRGAPKRPEAEERKAAAAGPDLMSEDEFQSLYGQALTGGSTTPVPAAPAVPADAPSAEPELLLDAAMEVAPEPAPVPPAPPAAPARPPAEAAAPRPAPHGVAPPGEALAGPPPVAPQAAPVPPPAPPAPDLSPLTFAAAQAQLAQSSDREDVARTVLRFASGKWRRTLLLSVQGDLVTGWVGLGEGVRADAVRRIGIALVGQSTFKLVCDLRSHYAGPVKSDASSTRFYKVLGGAFPTTAVLLPLLVRGKVVHLLYMDNGPGKVTPPDVGELMILSQGVARSYEAIIRRRQQGA